MRLVHFLTILPGSLITFHRTWPESDMYIFDQWARSIAQGDVLGREIYYPLTQWQLKAAPPEKWMEWHGSSPVFYKAPLYAYLVALAYWLFGEAILPIVMLQILVSFFSALFLFKISEKLLDRPSALLAVLLYALYAPAIHYDVFMLRNSWIVLLSLIITNQLTDLRPQPTVRRAYWLGITVGVSILLNEGFLTLPLLVAVLLVWWFHDQRLMVTLGGGFLLGLAIASIPLVARNLFVGAPPLSLAALGNAIFAASNAADTYPYFFGSVPPSFVSIMDQSGGSLVVTVWASLRTFQGELGAIVLFYIRKASGLLIPFEYPDNANFYYAGLKSPLLRFLPTYSLLLPISALGLACGAQRLRKLEALLPVALSLLIGMMITHPNSRYRAMLSVYLMPLAGLTLARFIHWTKERRFLALIAGLSGCLLISFTARTLEQRAVFKGLPKEVFKYRPFEFWVSSAVYAREKRYPEAIGELLQLVYLNPDPSIRSRSLLIAAKYQAHEGRKDLAQRSLEQATQINGDDPEFLMEVGDFHLEILKDAPGAMRQYQKALGLGSSDSLRDSLRQRLSSLSLKHQRQP